MTWSTESITASVADDSTWCRSTNARRIKLLFSDLLLLTRNSNFPILHLWVKVSCKLRQSHWHFQARQDERCLMSSTPCTDSEREADSVWTWVVTSQRRERGARVSDEKLVSVGVDLQAWGLMINDCFHLPLTGRWHQAASEVFSSLPSCLTSTFPLPPLLSSHAPVLPSS